MFRNSVEVVTVVYMQLHMQQPSPCMGQDPGTLVFYQSEMRRHLYKMLKEKKLTMFPVLKKKRSVRVTEAIPS